MKTRKPKTRARGQMKPLSTREVTSIQNRLHTTKEWRDLALFRLAIDSMLRASDLVRICADEITDHKGDLKARGKVIMKKTGKTVEFSITDETKEAIALWMPHRPAFAGDWLFPGREAGDHLSEVQYRRLAKEWFKAAGLDTRFYSTHSLRRTKAAELYRKTHNIEAIRKLLGHENCAVTVRYLGVEMEDALKLADQVRI